MARQKQTTAGVLRALMAELEKRALEYDRLSASEGWKNADGTADDKTRGKAVAMYEAAYVVLRAIETGKVDGHNADAAEEFNADAAEEFNAAEFAKSVDDFFMCKKVGDGL